MSQDLGDPINDQTFNFLLLTWQNGSLYPDVTPWSARRMDVGNGLLLLFKESMSRPNAVYKTNEIIVYCHK